MSAKEFDVQSRPLSESHPDVAGGSSPWGSSSSSSFEALGRQHSSLMMPSMVISTSTEITTKHQRAHVPMVTMVLIGHNRINTIHCSNEVTTSIRPILLFYAWFELESKSPEHKDNQIRTASERIMQRSQEHCRHPRT